MARTEYAVTMWAMGNREAVDFFDTYQEAYASVTDCNDWAKTQAGDYFFTVEPIEVEE